MPLNADDYEVGAEAATQAKGRKVCVALLLGFVSALFVEVIFFLADL